MGRRRAKSPFEDNPVINGFLEWMDAPEGQQSIQALDLVFDALEHAGVDARQRKIVWADGKRLSIELSAERIHAEHPDVACDVIETHVLGWLESCTPEAYSERQLEELDRLIEPWLDDYERTSRAVRSSGNSALSSLVILHSEQPAGARVIFDNLRKVALLRNIESECHLLLLVTRAQFFGRAHRRCAPLGTNSNFGWLALGRFGDGDGARFVVVQLVLSDADETFGDFDFMKS